MTKRIVIIVPNIVEAPALCSMSSEDFEEVITNRYVEIISNINWSVKNFLRESLIETIFELELFIFL